MDSKKVKTIQIILLIVVLAVGAFMVFKHFQKEPLENESIEIVSPGNAQIQEQETENVIVADELKEEASKEEAPVVSDKKIVEVKKSKEKTTNMKHAVIETNMGNIEVELWEDKTPKTVENFAKLAKEKFYEGIYFHRVIPDFMIQGGCPNTLDNDRSNDGSGDPGYKFADECYEQGGVIKGKIVSDDDAFSVFTKVILPYLQTNKEPDKEILDLARACQTAQSGEPLKAHPVEYYTAKTGFKGEVQSQGKLINPVEYGTLCMANSGPNTNGSQFFIVTKKEGASWLNGKHTVFGRVTSGMDIVHKIENLPRDKRDNPLQANQAIIKKVTVK